VEGVLRAVHAVLSPLIWLIPGFSASALARGVVDSLNRSAQIPGSVVDLFNPLSPAVPLSLGAALSNVALAGIALAAALLAVVVADHSWAAARNALALLAGLGRALPLTLALFLYSLAAFNATVALFVPATPLPFRVGALGLLALIAAFSFLAGIAAGSLPGSAASSAVLPSPAIPPGVVPSGGGSPGAATHGTSAANLQACLRAT
jgi:hypothetical protein